MPIFEIDTRVSIVQEIGKIKNQSYMIFKGDFQIAVNKSLGKRN